MKPAIAYLRYPPRPKKKKLNDSGGVVEMACESCETQLAYIRRWCELEGYELVAVYRDEGRSGKDVAGRPEFARALDHACSITGTLVIYKLDRFARNTSDALLAAEKLRASNAHLASCKDRLDTSTPMGRLFFTLMAAIAAWERETIVERTIDAMGQYQSEGRRMTARDKLPLGWMLDPEDSSRMIVNPAETTALTRIRELLQSGEFTDREIARILNQEGHKPRGKKWYHGAVGKVRAELTP
jgi:site-specific DNA recombinase